MSRSISFPDIRAFSALSNQEKINILITAASLAPSTVNTQPWLFSIDKNKISIYLNPKRKLPTSDPTGRQAYISLGAAFANIELIAKSYGLEFSFIKTPGLNEEASIAHFIIKNFITKDDNPKIREALLNRHTNRFPFETKPLSPNFVEKIQNNLEDSTKIVLIEDRDTINKITPLVLEAVFNVFSKKDWCYELSYWIKPSLKKYLDGMPGYYLGIPKIISFLMPFVLRYGSVAGIQLKIHQKMLNFISAYGVITSVENSILSWFNVGMSFEKIAIEAEINNIKIGILTAPIEIQDCNLKLKNILQTNDYLQMFFRIGYTSIAPIFSPRLPLNLIIKT